MWSRTRAVWQGLAAVISHHGAAPELCLQLKNQLHSYLDVETDEGGWSARAKHMLNSPLNQYLRNEPAKQGFPDFKASGGLLRWMRPRLHKFSRKNTHLWYSWFQAKRSALPASVDLIEETYRKHCRTLETEDCGKLKVINEIFDNKHFKSLLKGVRDSVSHAMKAKKGKPLMHQPSTSACQEQSRKKGGSQMELMYLTKSEQAWRPISSRLSDFVELVRMDLLPRVFQLKSREVAYNVVRCVYRSDGVDDWHLLSGYPGIWDTSVPLACTIQGVVEPLKVRVISKGPALPYYTQKPLQKALHDHMRKLPCFKLIGQTFCPTMLMDIRKASEPEIGPLDRNRKWLSVDYSAATDGLSWMYSGRILQEVLRDLPLEDQLRAFKVLGPHKLQYGATRCHKVGEECTRGHNARLDMRLQSDHSKYLDHDEVGPDCTDDCFKPFNDRCSKDSPFFLEGFQATGQLMGSILSFPILCLANMGVYFAANEEALREKSAKESLKGVLCNGDDMLYIGDADTWDRHVSIGESVGLKMSPGKAYQHSDYSNVNSVSCHYNLLDRTSVPFQVNFLNTGLLFGQHKVLQKKEDPAERSGTRDLLPEEADHIHHQRFSPTKAEEPDPGFPPGRSHMDSMEFRLLKLQSKLEVLGPLSEKDGPRKMKWRLKLEESIEALTSEIQTEKELRRQLALSGKVPDKLLGKDGNVDTRKIIDRKLLDEVDKARTGNLPDKDSLSSIINLLIRGCLPGQECQVLKMFLRMHKDAIQQECQVPVRSGKGDRFVLLQRNLFIPISRGGMGVLPPLGWKTVFTPAQKMYGRLLDYLNKIPSCPATSPLPGYPVESRLDFEISPWDLSLREKNPLDVSNRPYCYNPSLNKKIGRGRFELTQDLRFYSSVPTSVVVDEIRHPYLRGRREKRNEFPAREVCLDASPMSFEEMGSILSTPSWSDSDSESPIWFPDQPYDRLSFSCRRPKSRDRSDLLVCGDVESNPGPYPGTEDFHPPYGILTCPNCGIFLFCRKCRRFSCCDDNCRLVGLCCGSGDPRCIDCGLSAAGGDALDCYHYSPPAESSSPSLSPSPSRSLTPPFVEDDFHLIGQIRSPTPESDHDPLDQYGSFFSDAWW